MSKKIEISGKGLLVTETVGGAIELSEPFARTWYKEADLIRGRISFYDLDGTNNVGGSFKPIDLADAVDSALVAFTESSFRTFCTDNLGGFSPGVSASLTTTTTDSTATLTDATILMDGTSNTVTVSLPSAVGIKGKLYTFKSINSTFQTAFTPDGTETTDGVSGNKILTSPQSITIQSDGANWVVIGI